MFLESKLVKSSSLPGFTLKPQTQGIKKMVNPLSRFMFVKTNIGLQTPSHHPPEFHDQQSLFCHKVNKFSKGRTFSPIISMRGHEWVKGIFRRAVGPLLLGISQHRCYIMIA